MELLPGEVARQIVYAPPHEGAAGRRRVGGWLSWRPSPAWVLVLTETRLLLATIEPDEPMPKVTAAPLADMLRLDIGEILLYAWVEWSWAADGELRQERVYFNSVRQDLFARIVNTTRRDIIEQTGPQLRSNERDLASFKGLPYKFENMIPREVLIPGEKAEAVVHQPAIWGHHLGLLPYKRAPATVAVLTAQHLTIVQDDLSQQKAAYGLITCYCPRSRVAAIEIEQRQNDLWLNVTLRWEGAEEKLCYLFEAEAEPGLQGLIAKLERSTSASRVESSGNDSGSSDDQAKVDGTGEGAGVKPTEAGEPH
jgi:hypothetical protein